MSRATTWGAGLLTGPVLVVLVAGPAAAHDRVVPASPAVAQTLPGPPSQVRLALSGQPEQALGQVVVTDGAGQPRGAGALVLEGTEVVQALDGAGAPGLWRAAYRVVSSDGHPVSGEWTFTVQAAVSTPPATSTPAPVPSAGVADQSPTAPQSTAPPPADPLDAGPAGTPAGQDDAGSVVSPGWVAAAAGVAAAAAAAALVRARQGRQGRQAR